VKRDRPTVAEGASHNGRGWTPVSTNFQLVVRVLGIAIALGVIALIVFMIVFIFHGF